MKKHSCTSLWLFFLMWTRVGVCTYSCPTHTLQLHPDTFPLSKRHAPHCACVLPACTNGPPSHSRTRCTMPSSQERMSASWQTELKVFNSSETVHGAHRTIQHMHLFWNHYSRHMHRGTVNYELWLGIHSVGIPLVHGGVGACIGVSTGTNVKPTFILTSAQACCPYSVVIQLMAE